MSGAFSKQTYIIVVCGKRKISKFG